MLDINYLSDTKFNIETIESHSEIVAKYILEKLISYTIYEENIKQIDKNLNLHCYDAFTKKVLQDLVKFEYMAFDKDEFSSKHKGTEENKVFFNQIYFGSNNWSQSLEPVIILVK